MKNKFLYFALSILYTHCVFAYALETDEKKEAAKKINEGSATILALEASSEAKLGKLLTKLNHNDAVYSLTVEGSIDEKQKSGVFADLDGLKDGTKVSFGYSKLFFNDAYHQEQTQILTKRCSETALPKILIDAYNEIQNCRKKDDVAKVALTFTAGQAREAFLAGACKTEIENEAKIKKDCEDYASNVVNPIAITTKEKFWVKIISVEVAGSDKNYTWADPDSLAEEKDGKSSYSAQAQYGYINQDYQRINIGVRYEKAWKGKDEETVCSPYEDAPTSFTCNEVALGEPSEKEAKILYLEGKTYLGRDDSQAVSVRVSRDFESHITGVEIPYYLWKDKDSGGLQAGLKLGWVSDTQRDKDKKQSDTMLSVFFNKQFSIGY